MARPFTYFEPARPGPGPSLWKTPTLYGIACTSTVRDQDDWTFQPYDTEIGDFLHGARPAVLRAAAEAVMGMLIEIGLVEILEQQWPEYEDNLGSRLDVSARVLVEDIYLALAIGRAPTGIVIDTITRITDANEYGDPELHWMTVVELSMAISLLDAGRLDVWQGYYQRSIRPRSTSEDELLLRQLVRNLYARSAITAYVEWIYSEYERITGLQYPGSPGGWQRPLARQVDHFLSPGPYRDLFLAWVFAETWRQRVVEIRSVQGTRTSVPVPATPTQRLRGQPLPAPLPPKQRASTLPPPRITSPMLLGQLAADLEVLGRYPYDQISGGAFSRVINALRNRRWPSSTDARTAAAALRQRAAEMQASGLSAPGTIRYLLHLADELDAGPDGVGARRPERPRNPD